MKLVIAGLLIISAFYAGGLTGMEAQRQIAIWSGAAEMTSDGEFRYIDGTLYRRKLDAVPRPKPNKPRSKR